MLVRPSYVLGGQGMEIAYDDQDIREYMETITKYGTPEHPISVDQYIMGQEIEVDAICDGEHVLIPGIMEHVERAGVHSGDSISVYPARSLSAKMVERVTEVTCQLALNLHVKGMINIQYIVMRDQLYVIEVNPRSSRTVPYISKVTGVPMVRLAVRAALGIDLSSRGYGEGLYPSADYFAIKVPVFSFEKLPNLEISLGPEMKSTGEVLGLSRDYNEAVLKGLIAAGLQVPQSGAVLLSVKNKDKQELVAIAEDLAMMGYDLYATPGTANVLNHAYVPTNVVHDEADMEDKIRQGFFKLIINTPTHGRDSSRTGFKIRRLAVENGLTCLTSLDTARALAASLKLGKGELI